MQVVTVIRPSDIDRALASAREIGAGGELEGLATLPGAGLKARLEEAWEAIEAAVWNAHRWGRDAAQAAVDAAVDRAEEAIESAGAKASELREILAARMQEYVAELTDEALAKIRPSIGVGNRTLELSSIQLSQRVAFSGSVKLSY